MVEFCFIANIRIKKLHHTPSDRSYKEIKGNSSTKQIQSLFFFYQLLKITILKQNKIATVTRKQKKKIVFCWPYIIYYFNKISTTLCTVIENTILNNWIHCLLTVWIVLQLALFTLLSSYKQTHPIPGCQVEIFVTP